MVPRNARWRSLAGVVVPLVALLLVVGCGPVENYPQTTLAPKSDFARMIDDIYRVEYYLALLVFVLVEAALLYVIFRFRGKPTDPEPEQIHGNTMVEVIWTAIPALVLAALAVPTVKTIFRTYEVPADGNELQVDVIGHQWWWEFRYPQYGLVTANELHVPTGRTVSLRMVTQDVLHSFWLPQFAAKRDVFQNRTNTLWFKAETAGEYPGACAEFCGIQHGRMDFIVIADEPTAFEAYLGRLKASAPLAAGAPAPADSVPADTAAGPTAQAGGTTTTTLGAATPALADTTEGAQLFLQKGCIGCHSLDATKPMGVGPNLAGVGTRTKIAAGWLENTDANLQKWIQHPQEVKTGVLMPNLGLTDAEAQALVAYLRQH
jgi:cytochrome c oxidase subunit 2